MNIEQTMDLLKAANPVPNEDVTAPPYETSADYLATLEQRSDDMRLIGELDSEAPPTPPNRGRLIAMAVAAAVVVAAIGYGLIGLFGPGNDVIDGGRDIDLDDPLTVLPGTWESIAGTFTFTSDLTYSVTDEAGVKETGTYRLIGTLLTLVTDADSPVCGGDTDTFGLTIGSADLITIELEAAGCEAHFVLLCVSPLGTPAEPGCGRLERLTD